MTGALLWRIEDAMATRERRSRHFTALPVVVGAPAKHSPEKRMKLGSLAVLEYYSASCFWLRVGEKEDARRVNGIAMVAGTGP